MVAEFKFLALILALYLLSGCTYIPRGDRGPDTYAFPFKTDSKLRQMLSGYPETGRAMVANDPKLALTLRLDLIDVAEHSIDIQYFIWQNDLSGILVIDRLIEAADRGVRIRALVDDIQLDGLVPRLIVIGSHPNIEVRIFNPFSVRVGIGMAENLFRMAEFFIDGNRLNHRMHNKLLVVDNQLALLGGRNIGDDYFGLSTHRNFIDTDLLLSGLLVQELSDGFDTYWNSRWAVPVEELISFTLVSDDLALLRQRIDDRLASYPELTALVDPARIEETIMSLGKAHELDEASILLDSPDVTWGEKPDEIANALAEVTRSTHLEILIVSPYLVPTKRMLDIGRELEERGVKIRIVTNSLASNDVVMAHAAYANFRRTILDIDLELYEFRGDPAIMRNNQAENYSLHSKFILFDEWIFLGSPNLDPRSLQLNTELAVLLRSQTLSAELRNYFYQLIDPDNAWRVESEANNLVWRSSSGTLDRQPAKSSWQRFQSWLMMLLPVKNQL